MSVRNASATWNGTLNEGSGTMKLGSGLYEGPFSFASRFESGSGTNPEETDWRSPCRLLLNVYLRSDERRWLHAHECQHHGRRPSDRRSRHQQD